MNERFYRLRIQMVYIKRAIWRRFVVPPVLRWIDCMMLFRLSWVGPTAIFTSSGLVKKQYTEYPEFKEDGLPCGRFRLVDLIKQKGRTFRYPYDFVDGWEHELVLEKFHRKKAAWRKNEHREYLTFIAAGWNALTSSLQRRKCAR